MNVQPLFSLPSQAPRHDYPQHQEKSFELLPVVAQGFNHNEDCVRRPVKGLMLENAVLRVFPGTGPIRSDLIRHTTVTVATHTTAAMVIQQAIAKYRFFIDPFYFLSRHGRDTYTRCCDPQTFYSPSGWYLSLAVCHDSQIVEFCLADNDFVLDLFNALHSLSPNDEHCFASYWKLLRQSLNKPKSVLQGIVPADTCLIRLMLHHKCA